MDKERKPEERMNQGPLVPEQEGNLPKTKKKTLIMKMLDAFLIALLVLSSVIVVVSMFGHEIFAILRGELVIVPESAISGGKPAVPSLRIAEPGINAQHNDVLHNVPVTENWD